MTQENSVEGREPGREGRTPEQQAAVRRRALPVGIAAAVLAVAGVVILLQAQVSAFVPPNLLGVNMTSCAILMGAGILFYARGTPGTRLAAVLSVVGIVAGMGGMMVYTRQAVMSRQAREEMELRNVQAVAKGAAAYAAGHEGAYPTDMLVMLEGGQLAPAALQSPFGQRSPLFDQFEKVRAGTSRVELLKSVETAADYLYLGGDLKGVPGELAGEVMVAASTNTVMRENYAVAFADGKARFITVEEVPGVMAACNQARGKMGLGVLKAPPVIQAALEEAKGNGGK